MPEWGSYAAGDFLPFSPRAYWRLFELHNQAVWPLQLATLGLGLAILVWLARPRPGSDRAISLILAALWAWVAWSFLLERYATINWAAVYVAPFFLAQALLLAWFGGYRGRLRFQTSASPPGLAGLGLFIYALALHPLVAPLSGRPSDAAEIFGAAPDPTSMATLGLLAAVQGGHRVWLLRVLPLAWCLVSAATLLAMDSWLGWILLVAMALTFLAAMSPRAATRP